MYVQAKTGTAMAVPAVPMVPALITHAFTRPVHERSCYLGAVKKEFEGSGVRSIRM